MKNFFINLAAIATIACIFISCASKPAENASATSNGAKPLNANSKIYVVGDSTVCEYFDANGMPTDNYYLPRYGYGTQLAKYLNIEPSQVVNLALSGRSSKSFLTEANYKTLKDNIKAGDYLIIGFGHNDEKSAEDARFTDPNGSISAEKTAKGTSLKYCFNENYIKLAKDKGATPILCTPITRYDDTGKYSGSKVHVTSDGDYPAAIIALGKETNTTVIDLTKITADIYKADNEAAKSFHAHTTYSSATKAPPYDGTETADGRDDTHINMFGAKMIAYQFAQSLLKTDCALKAQVKTDVPAPTKAADYVAALSTTYSKPMYNAFVPAKNAALKVATVGGADWYKSAFGVLGGASKVADYSMSYSNDKFSIVAGNGSKFAASQDGMGAIFTQIPVSKNFKATVKAKVVAAASSPNGQVACGLMLRDDILINVQDTTLTSNFVAAGVRGDGNAIFNRNSGTLSAGEASLGFAVGNEYVLTIERVGQTVDVTVSYDGNDATQKFTDFDFVAVDNGNMYLCLFANRGLTVEFTELSFEITGESQGA